MDSLTPQKVLQITDRLDPEARSALFKNIRELALLLIESQLMPAVERAAMGVILAQVGDTRPGVCLKNHVPDIVWVDIPAGEFVLGSEKKLDPVAKDFEVPQHRLELPAYRISRYPVTYSQYEAFVRSDGYINREYWTDESWKWKKDKVSPEMCWHDPAYHVANLPILGVTWYEAQAFCRWLSPRLKCEVRLPTEAEWEKAARGTEGWLYPYEGVFDPNKGNTEATGIGRPCAVGLFPEGASPYGVMDMSGNAFEWTSSRLQPYPYDPTDGREAAPAKGTRVFRGGAYCFDSTLARAAFRSHYYPFGRYDWVGFRVCTSG